MDFRLWFGRGRSVDPGARWADEILAPLRRARVDCDVASQVMARVRPEQPAAARSTRPPRVAWTAALAFGGASLAFLIATLLVLFVTGDDGVRATLRGVAALGRAVLHVWERAVTVVLALLGATAPLLRAAREILEAAAPLVNAAGTVVALCGVLAILYSSYAFASARRTAPQAGPKGGAR